ncbi:hypothetical protein KIN20_008909 [Parelaphostrongylus tenuis]|uniref:GATA-type domain-containing protein n=1 Tax=Parelaphostrongylus tenuis TaxID=148309 RepID=A0AAD5M7F7_PARTN|nr:hypothetical protein KIN20_008909 [Parelaphostrongylus tenuis]
MSRDILQKWPERPEYGRYSLQYECLNQKRIKTARERNCAAADASTEEAKCGSSETIVPLQSCSAPKAKSSSHLVDTPVLSSSTTDIKLACSMQTSTSDDVHTLGEILQTSFHITDLHRPPDYPVTMTTFICPVQPPPVSSGTPRPNGNVNADIEFANCRTETTSEWRRSAEGKRECNACYLYFRKHGQARPASMRRDTVIRRNRLPRCNLGEEEAKCNPTDYGQIQKPPTIPTGSQSNAARNFFVPSNAALPRAVSTLPSTVHYSAQNSMVISYVTKRSLFNAVNVERQSSPLEGNVNADIEFANCRTKTTSEWRRSAEGKRECK